MKKERFYSIVIIILLLLNMGTLGFLWTDKKGVEVPVHPPLRPEPGSVIIRELNLDNDQQLAFQKLKRQHRKSTDSVQRQIKEAQNRLFRLVQQDEMNVQERDSLLAEIEKRESAKHLITIEHFHDIRAILRDDQKELFNHLMEEIGSRITGPAMPPRGQMPPPRH